RRRRGVGLVQGDGGDAGAPVDENEGRSRGATNSATATSGSVITSTPIRGPAQSATAPSISAARGREPRAQSVQMPMILPRIASETSSCNPLVHVLVDVTKHTPPS